jgi:hypothetical protein
LRKINQEIATTLKSQVSELLDDKINKDNDYKDALEDR